MIDQDHFCFVPRLQAKREQRRLGADHASEKKIVAGESGACGIKPPGPDHQADRDAAEQARPGLFDAETQEFVKSATPPLPCNGASEPRLAYDQSTKRQRARCSVSLECSCIGIVGNLDSAHQGPSIVSFRDALSRQSRQNSELFCAEGADPESIAPLECC